MNKRIYSLIALGALLFVACSDNSSPVSGSTSVPNMGNNLNNLRSPVLCSVAGVKDSLEAVEKGCIWSPTMWNRTSGYRVHTGFDNGTNTSGIWTWHVEQSDGGNVRFEWPGVATAEYDSMALADVIDKCGGSLCGKVVYELNENKADSDAENVFDRRASVEFYFAGKDSLGNIKEVDASALQGICMEYSGDISVEFIPSDSIASLNKISTYGFRTYSWDSENLLSKSKKTCNIFGGFGIYTFGEMDWSKVVPMKEVLAHLKGIRIIFNYNEENTDFNIISIDWYNLANVPMTDAHPYDETCEPIYVEASYCDCEFTTEDRALDWATVDARFYLDKKKNEAENDTVPLSDLTKVCLKNALDSLDNLQEIRRSYAFGSVPCDNPRPLQLACADGSHSTTIEFYEKYGEYMDKIEKPIEEKMIASADSLFNYCMSLNN